MIKSKNTTIVLEQTDEEKNMAAQVPQIGLKSFMADLKGIQEKLIYKSEQYERLTTKHDFVTQSSGLASIGLAESREVVLISEQDKQNVLELWNKIFAKEATSIKKAKGSLSSHEYITQLLARVSQFSNECLIKKTYPNGSASQKRWLEVMIASYLKKHNAIDIGSNGSPDVRAAIPLFRFIVHRCGVCRHAVLINSIITASLVNTGHLPKGQVRQFRSGDSSGYHAVMTYITNGTIWVLDTNYPSPFYLVPLNGLPARPKDHTNEARALRFKNAYGINFYNEMFERLLPKQNVVAANPNANVVAPNPYGNAAAAGAGAARAVISHPRVEKPAVAQPQRMPAEAAAQNVTPNPDLEAQELLRILLGDIPPEIKKILDEIDDNQDKMVMVEGIDGAAFCRFEGKWDAEARVVGNARRLQSDEASGAAASDQAHRFLAWNFDSPNRNGASSPSDGFRQLGGPDADAPARTNEFVDVWGFDSLDRCKVSSPSNDLDVMDNVWEIEKVIRLPK